MKIPRYVDRIQQGSDQAMTPMIDVVFLLLIFFVCASIGQVPELLIATELSAGDVAAESDPEPLPFDELWIKLLHVDDVTVVEVNGVEHPDLDAFAVIVEGLVVAEAAAEIPAILDIGPTVPMGDVIEVYDLCVMAGFASINFATDEEITADPNSTGL